MTPSAVIFDMDGLLLDTERLAFEAFQSACSELKVTVAKDLYVKCIGTNPAETDRILGEGLGEDFPLAALKRTWDDIYKNITLTRTLPLKPGVVELLEHLAEDRRPLAVATSTKYDLALSKLQKVGILDRFAFVVAGDQVSRGKPDPEIYSTAAERLGFQPAECLALEDSNNGVKSAHGAGLAVIQVPDMVPPSAEVLALGHRVMSSLHEVRVSLFGT